MKLTNMTSSRQVIRLADGSDEDFAPGETRTVSVDKDQPRFSAELAAGVWSEGKPKAEAKAPSTEATAARAAS